MLATGGTGGWQGKRGGIAWRSWTLDELKLAPGLRLLGLDLGEKTIGLALSDRLLSVATPMQTLKRGKFAADAARLDIIISEQGVGGLVVGLPLNMDGSDGPSRPVGPGLWPQLGGPQSALPVVFRDERLSTSAVTRTLLEADASRKRRGEVVDKMAAAYILQGALDRLRNLQMSDDSRSRPFPLAAAGSAPAGRHGLAARSAFFCWSAPRRCSPATT